ncbi:MAG: tRNA preQ1(34) S-adenosylmethionine ribosyltransferase-isomerase QueA [Flavobacteriales bacterium]
MKLGQFRYKLPEELIASYPARFRDESRMMVVHRQSGKIEHKMFKDILEYFEEGDIMVNNNSLVKPCRLYANKEKTGSIVEVFMLRELNEQSQLWDTVVEPARKIRIGNKLYFGENDELVAEVIDNTTSKGRTLRFLYDGTHEDFINTIYRLGEMPVPKYINRPVEEGDTQWYQTMFAKVPGSVQSPTAGLHFSRELVKRCEINGIDLTELTFHIGLGTFKQVEVEDLTKHKMESEQCIISEECANAVNKAIAGGHKVCAVGNTVLRGLESSVSTSNTIKPYDGWVSSFIYPPHEFKVCDAFVTNFHQSESALLMCVTAYGGYDLIMHAYNEAIKNKYRFLCYGDAMLILNS